MRVQASQDVRRLGKTFVLLLVRSHKCLGVLRLAGQACNMKRTSFNLFDYVLALIFVLALQLAQTCWMTVAGDTVFGLSACCCRFASCVFCFLCCQPSQLPFVYRPRLDRLRRRSLCYVKRQGSRACAVHALAVRRSSTVWNGSIRSCSLWSPALRVVAISRCFSTSTSFSASSSSSSSPDDGELEKQRTCAAALNIRNCCLTSINTHLCRLSSLKASLPAQQSLQSSLQQP